MLDSKNLKQISDNNINYELSETSAKVIESKNATGDISIPISIEFGGEKYPILEIGKRAFYNSSISSISFPLNSEVQTFGDQSFGICPIKTIKLPPKLSEIGRGWCIQTPSLQKIEVSEGCQNYISENNAIYTSDKSKLIFCQRDVESFEIPSPVSSIEIFAFHIQKLKKITFAENSNLKQINCSAFRESAIECIEFPPTLQIIRDYAFYGCHNLKKVTFQEGSQLKEISHHAFDGTALVDLTLSSQIAKIGMSCFKNAKNLKELTILNETSLTILKDAFLNVSPDFHLCVRKSSIVDGEGKSVKTLFLQEPNDEILLNIQHLQTVLDWMVQQPHFSE